MRLNGLTCCTLVCVLLGMLTKRVRAQQSDQVFLFTYFLSETGGTYLAWSENGRSFTTLNGGQPIVTPPQANNPPGWPSGESLMRDPSLAYRDGTFHLVWTTDWTGTIFGHASSTDLKTWSTPQAVSPYTPQQIAIENPKNIWAPEVFYDQVAGHYKIVWASTHQNTEAADGDNSNVGSWDNRQWFTTTTDFQTYTQASLYYDGGKDVLDGFTTYDDRGTATTNDDRWVMAIKDNNASAQGNNDRKIRLVFNDDLNITGNDWSAAGGAIAGNGTALNNGEDAEGPSLIKNGDEWLLYWDAYNGNDYGLASSTDLATWTDLTSQFHLYAANGSEIVHPRHGTVLLVPRSTLSAFSEVPMPEPATAMLVSGATLLLTHRRPLRRSMHGDVV